MSNVLVFDAGKTGCRAGLWADGELLARGEGPGAAGIADPDGVEQALARLADADDDMQTAVPRNELPLDTVVVGLAGMMSAADRAPQLRAGVAARYPGARVVVTSDVVISHAGALDGHEGVVLAAGTGVSVLALSRAGDHQLVDGWGYLLGDAGSGYAIGRAGLDQALRHHDGRGGSADLLSRVEARWGEPRQVAREAHGSANPARVIASFARDVFAAAEEGCSAAARICEAAGGELARSVAAAARRARLRPPVTIATTGGLLNAGPVLTDPMDRHLGELLPGATRHPARGDALHGGYLMAVRPELPHHDLLTEPPTEGDR